MMGPTWWSSSYRISFISLRREEKCGYNFDKLKPFVERKNHLLEDSTNETSETAALSDRGEVLGHTLYYI